MAMLATVKEEFVSHEDHVRNAGCAVPQGESKSGAAGQSLKELITDALRKELEEKPSASVQSTEQFWRELKTIAKANSKSWKSRKGAVMVIREQRR